MFEEASTDMSKKNNAVSYFKKAIVGSYDLIHNEEINHKHGNLPVI